MERHRCARRLGTESRGSHHQREPTHGWCVCFTPRWITPVAVAENATTPGSSAARQLTVARLPSLLSLNGTTVRPPVLPFPDGAHQGPFSSPSPPFTDIAQGTQRRGDFLLEANRERWLRVRRGEGVATPTMESPLWQ